MGNVRIFYTIVILLFLNNTDAQNARINALGGTFIVDDISAVVNTPASSVNYRDVIQGTAYENGSFGPFIAIKSIGKLFSLGITANSSSYSNSAFYNDAVAFLDSLIDTTSNLPEGFPAFPHIIFAIDLPHVNFGCNIFYEKTNLSNRYIDNEIEQNSKKEISNAGITASVGLQFGKIGIYPYGTYAIPVMNGSLSENDSGCQISLTTNNNRTFSGGCEFGIYPENADIRIGCSLFRETYSFAQNKPGYYQNPRFISTSAAAYGGITIWPVDYLLLSFVYSFDIGSFIMKSDFPSDNINIIQSEEFIDYTHFVAASSEYTINIGKVDMQIHLRSGLMWYAYNSKFHSYNDSNSVIANYSEQYPQEVLQVTPTFGFGIQKSIFSFDVASKLAGWSGVVSGMPLVTGTLTIDFGEIVQNKRQRVNGEKKKKSKFPY
jgi:hypothetical protein